MTDMGRDGSGNEDRLPWLEPVEDVDQDEGIAAGRLFAGIVFALIAIGLVVGGIFWMRDRDAAGSAGAPATIIAATEPYKAKPAAPGGLQVEGQGDTAYAASQGADTNSSIDLSAVPEAPVAKPAAAPAPAPAPATPAAKAPTAPVVAAAPAPAPKAASIPTPKPAPAAPAKVEAAPAKTETASAPAASGPGIQLGAFSSNAKAEAAWKSLSSRFTFLAGLDHSVPSAAVGGSTVYRLRASGAGAAEACSKLKVAGETCIAIGK